MFAFPNKPKALNGFSPYLTVTNLASESVTVDVIFDAADYGITSEIAENGEETFELPSRVFLPNSNGITNRTIIVCSSGEISLYGYVSESKEDASMFSVDQFMDLDPWDMYIRGAYLAIPANDLGTEHYIVAYPKQQDFTSVFTVSALENNTAVNITFSSNSTPRSPRKFTLQFGESYQVLVTNDTTSSMVVSDKPVSVIAASKSETNSVFLLNQIPPKKSFGTEFVLTPFEGGSYDYCVIAPESTTISTCQVAGESAGTNSSECEEYLVDGLECIQNITANVYQKITSEYAVTVVQYMKGYTAGSTDLVCLTMLIVPPVESYISEVEFNIIGDGNAFMDIYIISEMYTAFEINGEIQDISLFLEAEIEGMMVYKGVISKAGRHIITSGSSGTKFVVIVYGGMHSDTGVDETTVVPTTTFGPTVELDYEGSGSGYAMTTVAVESEETTDVVIGSYSSFFAYSAGLARGASGKFRCSFLFLTTTLKKKYDKSNGIGYMVIVLLLMMSKW